MDSSVCKGACKKMIFHKHLFIGVLLVFIDINIGTFDIVPDIIGYLFILNAFMKVATQYAGLGVATTIILLVGSVISLFSPPEFSLLFSDETLSYSLPQQLIGLVLGIATIINYACMFAVSNTLIPIKETFLPKFLIMLLIIYELAVSFIYYLSGDEILLIFIGLGILIFLTHIPFLLFLWRRSKMEPIKPKPSDNTFIDQYI